ncbi:MAG: hypothetical protein GX347_05950 [Epulopiscium sp.]|nr:hypothetical protein [Candidatus Epulonipiscium sp.]
MKQEGVLKQKVVTIEKPKQEVFKKVKKHWELYLFVIPALLYFIVIASVSDPNLVSAGRVWIYYHGD